MNTLLALITGILALYVGTIATNDLVRKRGFSFGDTLTLYAISVFGFGAGMLMFYFVISNHS